MHGQVPMDAASLAACEARHQPGGMLVAPNACVQVAKHGR